MTTRHKALMLSIAGTALAVAAIGTASLARSTETLEMAETARTAHCEVLAERSGNGLTLEAVFYADGPAQGIYGLAVKSVGGSGSSTINQGGGFAAAGPGTVSLGRVTVGGASHYDITLTVTANGQTHICGDRPGSRV